MSANYTIWLQLHIVDWLEQIINIESEKEKLI